MFPFTSIRRLWKNIAAGLLTSRSRRQYKKLQRQRRSTFLDIEVLEDRLVPSNLLYPTYFVAPKQTNPGDGLGPTGYTPAQMRSAYGMTGMTFNGQPADGTGQTIAILDAYNDPLIVSEVNAFDQALSANLTGPTLYQQYGDASQFLTVFDQNGNRIDPSNTSVPVDPYDDWEGEEALDVEWAHAIAPGARIDLVEANDDTFQSLVGVGAPTAASLPGVSVVSMSFSGSEFDGEQAYDSSFLTPAGHQGVTFLAATGDYGSPSGYPAYSPNVVAVGGTTLYTNPDDSYAFELGWSLGSDSWNPALASAGGTSTIEGEPSYQLGVQNTGFRTNPDVSFDADPDTGAMVYDSYTYGVADAWEEYGGTSLATPCWAGLIAITNQGRSLAGENTLNTSSNPQQTLTALYSLPSSDFHDVTIGYNGSFFAGPGYDQVTGLGTPVANLLVADLATYGQTSQMVASPPSIVTAGNTFNITVQAQDNLGDLTNYNGAVTLSLSSDPGGAILSGNLTATAVNGVATFTDLSLSNVGIGYTLTAQAELPNNTQLDTVSSPFAVSPATDMAYNQNVTVPVSGTGYSIEIGGDGSPYFMLEQQFGLAEPQGTSNYYYNFHGDQEKYLVSTNGSNAANGNLYFILPDGSLYAWNGLSLSSSIAAGPVQYQGAPVALGAAVYADPTQLTASQPAYNSLAFETQKSLDLQAPDGSTDYNYNLLGDQEKWLISGNNGNAANGNQYVLFSSGALYAFDGISLATTLLNAPVASLPTIYYENPGLLINATPPGALAGVNARISGSTLTISNVGFMGTALIYVDSADRTQTFQVDFADNTPILTQPANQTADFSTPVNLTLNGSASFGGTLTYSAQVGGYNPLFALEQQFALVEPAGTSNYYFNYQGAQEKYLSSVNGSNAANGGLYFILPSGNLYAWDGKSELSSVAAGPVQFQGAPVNLGTAVYADPTQLTSAPFNPAAYSISQSLDLQAPAGTTNFYFNAQHDQEKYLVSGNGGNAANNNLYVLTSNGNLYAWTGVSLATTLQSTPVASLPTAYYENPGWLVNATAPGALAGVKVNVSGNQLTVTDGKFIGTAMVYVTASDGTLSTTQTFLVTFTDNGPTVTLPGNQTLTHAQAVDLPLSPTDADGAPITYSVQVGGYSALFAVEQQFGLIAPTGSNNYYYSYHGAEEKYLVSINGSNAVNGNLYFILPTGYLYAWSGISETTSVQAGPVQYQGSPVNLGAAAYADPTLLTSAPYNPTAFVAGHNLDLQAPAGSTDYYFNNLGDQEKYLVSGNGSNAANGKLYVLTAIGNLFAWDGKSLATTLLTTPVASLPTAYYENPGWLINPTPEGTLSGVQANIAGNTLTVSDTTFLGTATIYVTASDGVTSTTQSFLVTFTDSTPSITQPSNQTVPNTASVNVPLSATDAAGDAVTYTAQVGGYSSLFALEQQFGLVEQAGTTTYYYNYLGDQEKYLTSVNGSNAANGNLYFILPGGNLYAWDGISEASSVAAGPVQYQGAPVNLGAAVYANPAQLTSAPYNPVAYAASENLDLQAPGGTTDFDYNYFGGQEKYLVSGNGANAAGFNLFVLTANGNLYAWDGNSLTTTLQTIPVASLPTAYYENPAWLINATPAGAVAGVTANISAGNLTVSDPGDYLGTVSIILNVSDGALTNTLTFQVTFT